MQTLANRSAFPGRFRRPPANGDATTRHGSGSGDETLVDAEQCELLFVRQRRVGVDRFPYGADRANGVLVEESGTDVQGLDTDPECVGDLLEDPDMLVTELA